jgi:cell division protein FtsL
MTRFNFMLLLALLVCALLTVTSNHRSRKLFIELERTQSEQKRIGVEWGQLQLEQSTWAKHALVENMASRQLGMRVPDARRLQFINPDSTSAATAQANAKPEAASATAPSTRRAEATK